MKWLCRKTLYQVHGWAGLHMGLLLYVICLSGTAAVFGPELDWLIDPSKRSQEDAGKDPVEVAWGRIYNEVQKAHPQAIIATIAAPAGKSYAATAMISYAPGDLRYIFANPATGAIQGDGSLFNAKSFFRIFHKQFYIVPNVAGFHGTLIVGVFALLLLFSAVTGLLFLKGWWRALFRIRMAAGRRVFWSDLHRSLGVWTLLLSLVFAVTGIWYLAERCLETAGLPVAPEAPELSPAMLKELPAVMKPLEVSDLVQRAQAAFPNLNIDSIWLPARLGDPFIVTGQAEAVLVRSRANQVALHPYTGEVLGIRQGSRLPWAERLMETADPLHFGTFGGTGTRLIWFLAGLGISVAILAGAFLRWMRVCRPAEQPPGRRRRSVLISLAASIGVLMLSAFSAVGFICNQLVPSMPSEVATLDEPVEFPLAAGSLRRFDNPEEGRQAFALTWRDGLHANIVQAGFAWGGQGAPSTPAICYSDRLWCFLKPPEDGHSEILHVWIETTRGDRQSAEIHLSNASGHSFPFPAPPRPPVALYFLIGLFMLMVVLPLGAWFRLAR